MKPVFTHDCDECIFLGTYEWDKIDSEPVYDIYVHLSGGFNSFIARYGNDGPEYMSCIYGATSPTDYPTRIAYDRALEKGLIKKHDSENPRTYDEQIAYQERLRK